MQDLVKGWLLSVVDVADCATHSREAVDYKKLLHSDAEVQGAVQHINQAVVESFQMCYEYAESFNRFSFLWEVQPQHRFKQFLDKYGKPKGEQFPRTSLFALQIRELVSLAREMNAADDVQHIRWFRIDARPFKVAVANLLEASTDLYTDYLRGFFNDKLVDIHGFITSTHMDLERSVDVTSGSDLLMPVVLVSNRAIRRRRESIEESFMPLEEIVEFLEQHGKPVPVDQAETANKLVSKWAELQKFALQIKDKFAPFIAVDIEQLHKRADLFVQEEAMTIKSISESVCWLYETDEDSAYDSITGLYKEVCRHKTERDAIIELEDLLESPAHRDYSAMDKCEQIVRDAKHLWDAVICAKETFKVWRATKWTLVDPPAYLKEVKAFQAMIKALPETARDSEVCASMLTELDSMEATLPLIDKMRSSAIRHRHWKQLMDIGGAAFTVARDMILDDVLVLPFRSMPDDIASIAANADKELVIEEMLESIEKAWSTRDIIYVEHEATETPQVSDKTTELINDLQEGQVVLQGLLQHRTVAYFYETVIEWQTKLALCETTAKLAVSVQGLWERAQFLFAHDLDLKHTHGLAYELFMFTHDDFKVTMTMMKEEPNVIKTCGNHMVTDRLSGHLESFSRVRQVLSSWLQLKRQRFPRFYFLSDSELQVIMSEGPVSPKRLNKYLYRIIAGANKLIYSTRMSASGNEVLGIISADDEVRATSCFLIVTSSPLTPPLLLFLPHPYPLTPPSSACFLRRGGPLRPPRSRGHVLVVLPGGPIHANVDGDESLQRDAPCRWEPPRRRGSHQGVGPDRCGCFPGVPLGPIRSETRPHSFHSHFLPPTPVLFDSCPPLTRPSARSCGRPMSRRAWTPMSTGRSERLSGCTTSWPVPATRCSKWSWSPTWRGRGQ